MADQLQFTILSEQAFHLKRSLNAINESQIIEDFCA